VKIICTKEEFAKLMIKCNSKPYKPCYGCSLSCACTCQDDLLKMCEIKEDTIITREEVRDVRES